jgi:hypothetical protein
MDGYIRGVLRETSLWSLSTEGIPGYALEFLLLASMFGIAGYIIIKKKNLRRKNL